MVAPPRLEYVFTARVDVASPQLVGATAGGERRVIPILGGVVDGPRLRGTVLEGGADWQLVAADGTAYLEARYTVRTDDGALIAVRNVGIRSGPPDVIARIAAGDAVDPASYYFRTTPTFETGLAQHAWLTRGVFVATARREARRVIVDVFLVQ